MDRIVLITGSTRGIGYATAAEFLKHDDRVIVFCRHEVHTDVAVRRLGGIGNEQNVLGLVGDVREEKDVKKIVGQSLRYYGRIDVLINNAGVAAYRSIEETSGKEFDRIIETNLKGTFLFMRHVIPVMKREKKGVIINISSAMGIEAEADFSAYSASKFGVIGLTKAAAEEISEQQIPVYGVLPWAVDTTLLAGSGLELDPADVLEPEYVARKIFNVAKGTKKSGALIKVYPR
ncbi:MAG TPA: SDR family oxidoreductase [Syntrophorhabdales bacterium]|nr:SDR family oxidoreductase [Syntrophorhabdales bacterium]